MTQHPLSAGEPVPAIAQPARRFRFTAEFVVPPSPFPDEFWISFIRSGLGCSFELAKLGKGGDCVLVPNIEIAK